jgi:hypothetical protein
MSAELSEEEIFGNDIDPVDAIAAIRREEGNEEAAEMLSRDSKAKEDEAEVETAEADDTDDVETADAETTDAESDGEGDDEADTETVAEVVKRKFKANGQDFEFSDAEIMDQFEGVFGKAMDYTQKMQKMAPYRKMISALEEESIRKFLKLRIQYRLIQSTPQLSM